MTKYKTKFLVRLKSEVLDPEGKAICHVLNQIGYKQIDDVRVGKFIELSSAEKVTKEQAEEISQKVLMNPVIEECEYEFEG